MNSEITRLISDARGNLNEVRAAAENGNTLAGFQQLYNAVDALAEAVEKLAARAS